MSDADTTAPGSESESESDSTPYAAGAACTGDAPVSASIGALHVGQVPMLLYMSSPQQGAQIWLPQHGTCTVEPPLLSPRHTGHSPASDPASTQTVPQNCVRIKISGPVPRGFALHSRPVLVSDRFSNKKTFNKKNHVKRGNDRKCSHHKEHTGCCAHNGGCHCGCDYVCVRGGAHGFSVRFGVWVKLRRILTHLRNSLVICIESQECVLSDHGARDLDAVIREYSK